MKANRQPTLIGSVQRALRLLEVISAYDSGAPAKVLARDAQLPLGTAYHLLRTLVYEGYLQRQEDGTYVLGDRMGGLLTHGRQQVALSRARPVLRALRDTSGAAAYIALYQDGEITIADIVDGPKTPRADLWVGFKDAAHATALGKSILATLDPATRDDYLGRHDLNDLTPRTITDLRTLQHELEVVAAASTPDGATGLALDREEYSLGTACAAVPIHGADGDVVGAIGISVRARRLPELPQSAELLAQAAPRITRAFALSF